MKRIMWKSVSLILSLSIVLSMAVVGFVPVSFALVTETAVVVAGNALGPVLGNLAWPVAGAVVGGLSGVLGSRPINFSMNGNSFNPEFSYNYSPTTNSTYQYNGSGASYNYKYNSTNFNNYQVFNTTNQTIYNPITNNYYSYNEYYYNPTYDIFYFEGDHYNTYFTTNVTYVTYYIVDNVTESTYYAEVYYQLPDGRYSWDMKAEDVWGTYFIYDTVNYDEVAEDDGVTLGLWHLDGNYMDSSANQYGDIQSDYYNWVDTPFLSGSYLEVQSNVRKNFSLELSPDVKTIEFRVKMNGLFYSYGSNPNQSGYGSVPITIGNKINRTTCVPTSEWVSIALTRENDLFYIWVNGKKTEYTIPADGSEILFHNQSYPSNYIGTVGSSTSSYFCSVIYDEIRFSNKVLYTEDYTPRSQPFDTNLVMVLPETGAEGQVAIKSNTKANNIRVGGVRPTYPDQGDVYVVLNGSVVQNIQQFITDGWYSVEAAIWSNGQWNTFKGYDMKKYSIVAPDDGGSSDPDPTPTPPPDGGDDTGGSGGGLFDSLFTGLLDTLSGAIMAVLSLFASIFAFISALVAYVVASLSFLPPSITAIFTVSVPIILLLILIKFIRG